MRMYHIGIVTASLFPASSIAYAAPCASAVDTEIEHEEMTYSQGRWFSKIQVDAINNCRYPLRLKVTIFCPDAKTIESTLYLKEKGGRTSQSYNRTHKLGKCEAQFAWFDTAGVDVTSQVAPPAAELGTTVVAPPEPSTQPVARPLATAKGSPYYNPLDDLDGFTPRNPLTRKQICSFREVDCGISSYKEFYSQYALKTWLAYEDSLKAMCGRIASMSKAVCKMKTGDPSYKKESLRLEKQREIFDDTILIVAESYSRNKSKIEAIKLEEDRRRIWGDGPVGAKTSNGGDSISADDAAQIMNALGSIIGGAMSGSGGGASGSRCPQNAGSGCR